jgi:hypothetical protein
MSWLARLFQCKDSQSKKEWLAAYEEARNLQKEAANTKVTLHLFLSGSGIRCFFDPCIRDPGEVFSGSQIPNPYL